MKCFEAVQTSRDPVQIKKFKHVGFNLGEPVSPPRRKKNKFFPVRAVKAGQDRLRLSQNLSVIENCQRKLLRPSYLAGYFNNIGQTILLRLYHLQSSEHAYHCNCSYSHLYREYTVGETGHTPLWWACGWWWYADCIGSSWLWWSGRSSRVHAEQPEDFKDTHTHTHTHTPHKVPA